MFAPPAGHPAPRGGREDRGREPVRERNEGSRDLAGSFGRRDRDKDRGTQWEPNRGRNPDLEAEKLTGMGLARNYSEHDDRRGDEGSGARRRNPSPMAWRHDMFDSVLKVEPQGGKEAGGRGRNSGRNGNDRSWQNRDREERRDEKDKDKDGKRRKGEDERDSKTDKEDRRCGTPGCSYKITWHETLCCIACGKTGTHGVRCEKVAFVAPADEPKADEKAAETPAPEPHKEPVESDSE